MILQQLYADSDLILQDAPTPPMYDNILVQWEIKITAAGAFAGCINLGDKGGSRHCVPYNYGRSVDIVPNLLVDTADYALGPVAAPDDKKAVVKHQAFAALVQRCAQDTNNPIVHAVTAFLKAGGLAKEQLPKDIKAKDRVMFTVGGQDRKPTDEQDVQDFWRRVTEEECKGRPKPRGQCLITGLNGFVETILPCEIRVGGESAPLISVNEASGNSYGFEQALNGAVSLKAAEGFTKALNALMQNPDTRLRVGDVTYVFWRRTGPDTELSGVLQRPDEGDGLVKRLHNTPFAPLHTPAEKTARKFPKDFFALALSGNKTRVVFRDWMAMTEWDVNEHLYSWLLAQRIVSREGEEDKRNGKLPYFGVYEQAAALYREGKEINKADVSALVRVALHGDPVPRRMLAAVVRRCRLEGGVTHARAALLKLALYRDDKEKAELMITPEHMDRFNDNPAYVCGRLMAVLESLQYAALGPVNANIVDRFFGAAAAEPRRILGAVLLPQARRAYLSKLSRQKRGLFVIYTNQIEALLDQIEPGSSLERLTLPDKLTLEQQADFLLGYYHQHAHDRAGQKENAEKAQQRKAAEQKHKTAGAAPGQATLSMDNA